ncbi:MAG: type II toxin-antitoxin system HicA family toxin [Gammaproteobacteria bacterium]
MPSRKSTPCSARRWRTGSGCRRHLFRCRRPFPDKVAGFANCRARRIAQTGRVRVRDLIKILQHPVKRGTVTVSGNTGSEVTSGTLNSVLKQAGLKKDQLR